MKQTKNSNDSLQDSRKKNVILFWSIYAEIRNSVTNTNANRGLQSCAGMYWPQQSLQKQEHDKSLPLYKYYYQQCNNSAAMVAINGYSLIAAWQQELISRHSLFWLPASHPAKSSHYYIQWYICQVNRHTCFDTTGMFAYLLLTSECSIVLWRWRAVYTNLCSAFDWLMPFS